MRSLTLWNSRLGRRGMLGWTAELARWLLPPVALLSALLAGLAFGSVSIPLLETLHIVLFKIGIHAGSVTWSQGDEVIIWEIRLPGVLAAAFVGASLSIAGALFQAILRNPLADPYVIGTSAGAQLGVVVALLVPFQVAVLGFGLTQVCAFAGAMLTILLVYRIARVGGTTPVVTLLLAGFVTSSFLISTTSLLLYLGNKWTQVLSFMLGSVDVSEPSQLTAAGIVLVLAAAGAWAIAPRLDVIQLGEQQAAHVGLDVEALKLQTIVLASLLTAFAVTLGGVVAFVGLVVPHAVRLVYGPEHRVLIPTSAVGGATFLLVANVVAHVLRPPAVVPLGVITAVLGAPLFLHILRRGRRDYAL